MNLLRKKTLAEVLKESKKTLLKKNLGVVDLIFLGLGGIIGTGIFVLTGIAAAQYAGPSIILSFALGGIASIFTALSFSELGSMLPVSGSAYTYAYVALGEIFAALAGWTMLMVYAFGSATVASGWSGYLTGILDHAGWSLPKAWTNIPANHGIINAPAVMIVLFITLLLFKGTQGATKLNGILVIVKLAAIALFIVVATPHADFKLWENFAPNGFSGIATGAGFVFMAYTGFDTIATASEECKNANRDIPIGIIVSVVGSSLLYVIVSGLLTLIAPYQELGNSQPMAFALRKNGIGVGAELVAVGAMAGMTTVILSQIYGLSRVLLVMSRDGLFPKAFSKIAKTGSPAISVIFSGMVVAVIAGFLPVSIIGQLSSMSILLVFSMVSVGVIILRRVAPNQPRPFVCPGVYWVAGTSFALCMFLFSQLWVNNWVPFLASMSLGLGVYFLYGKKNSQLGLHQK